jgi:hypothetical protein
MVFSVWVAKVKGNPKLTWTKSGQSYWVPSVMAKNATAAQPAEIATPRKRFLGCKGCPHSYGVESCTANRRKNADNAHPRSNHLLLLPVIEGLR